MTKFIAILLLGFLVCAPLTAQQDDFKREVPREKKDPIEGKAPPALEVEGWLNTGGKALKLADLKGKVVVLDFWGVW